MANILEGIKRAELGNILLSKQYPGFGLIQRATTPEGREQLSKGQYGDFMLEADPLARISRAADYDVDPELARKRARERTALAAILGTAAIGGAAAGGIGAGTGATSAGGASGASSLSQGISGALQAGRGFQRAKSRRELAEKYGYMPEDNRGVY